MCETEHRPGGEQSLVVGSIDDLEVLRRLVGRQQRRELGQRNDEVVKNVGHRVVGSDHRAL